jgi:hypothetical protein
MGTKTRPQSSRRYHDTAVSGPHGHPLLYLVRTSRASEEIQPGSRVAGGRAEMAFQTGVPFWLGSPRSSCRGLPAQARYWPVSVRYSLGVAPVVLYHSKAFHSF